MGKDNFQVFVFGYCLDGHACSKTIERVAGFRIGRWGESDDNFSFGFNFKILVNHPHGNVLKELSNEEMVKIWI